MGKINVMNTKASEKVGEYTVTLYSTPPWKDTQLPADSSRVLH